MSVHSCIIHSSQKARRIQCPSVDEWINGKIRHIHALETLVIKDDEVLVIRHNMHEPFKYYTEQEKPGGKEVDCVISFIRSTQHRKIHRDSRLVVTSELGEKGNGTDCWGAQGFQLG